MIERIDALLPQTQCQRCGFPACKPYATAIVRNEADINQCPPGGAAGIHRLADLLGREFKPLSPIHGSEMPKQVVAIDESRCIGCTLCIQACPVDAIVGASKLMHTVIADHCTGCELCIPPCPVDCIDLIVAAQPDREKRETARSRNHDDELSADEKRAADAARKRYEFRQFRLARDQLERAERLALIAQNKRKATAAGNPENPERALIAAALERVRKNARHTE